MARTMRVTGIVTGSCVLLLLGLSLWNLAVTRWKYVRNPVPGSFASVEGRQMHIYCTGTGSPTVVLEAAASATWLAWRRVQPQLSLLTRVCAYDRAGHGWSELRPGLRDAETIVRELHSLLDQAGVQRPLVLAGHSAGGLYVREYARQFPAEVAGVVLMDSSSPLQLDALPGWRAAYAQNQRDHAGKLFWERVRVWSGWERLLGRCQIVSSGEPQDLASQYDALLCRPGFVGGEEIEYMDFERTSKQAARLTSFGNIPLLIISRDSDLQGATTTAEELAEERVWAQLQEGMKSLSPLSWRVIARGAGHGVHHDRLELVVGEVTFLIHYLRGGPPPRFGSTVTR